MTLRIFVSTMLAAMALLAGCAKKSEPQSEPATQGLSAATEQLSLPAIFSGTIPCADCEGITLTLDLRADSSYVERREYLGKAAEGKNVFLENGTWTAAAGKITLRPASGEGPILAITSAHSLRLLDRSGKEIDSQLNYDLTHVASYAPLTESDILYGTMWILTELRGMETVADTSRQPVHIQLTAEGSKVSGYGGCNRMTGSFAVNADTLIFGHMAATKMACPSGTDIEMALFEALDQALTYTIKDEVLTINSDVAVLARFKAKK